MIAGISALDPGRVADPSAAPLVDRPEWKRWVSRHRDDDRPVHRWHRLTHGYDPELVEHLIVKRFALEAGSQVLDPFCGSGTTLTAAIANGMTAYGSDLSPLAVLASAVKTVDHEPSELLWAADSVRSRKVVAWPPADPVAASKYFEDCRLQEMGEVLGVAYALPERLCQAVKLALVAASPRYARLARHGAGLAMVDPAKAAPSVGLREAVALRLEMMSDDSVGWCPGGRGSVLHADARSLPFAHGSIDAIITSPSYPNRCDYSRAYAVELCYALADTEQLWRYRRQQIYSHPEARPTLPAGRYPSVPDRVAATVAQILARATDPNTIRFVPQILTGWATDMAVVTTEMARVLRPGGHVAVVVANPSYEGIHYEADLVVAELFQAVGVRVDEIAVAARRRLSPQQERRYGPATRRESVIIGRPRPDGGSRRHGRSPRG